MTDLKSVQSDPYDAVLSDLRTKRDDIDTTIRMLEMLRDGRLGVASGGMTPPAATPAAVEPENDAGMFLGMSIVDAAKKLLKLRKRVMSNPEIAKDLQAGGLVMHSAEPANVIGSVLTRRFQQVGDVVKISRGVWGLKEWYPGRTFKAAPKAKTEPAPSADDEVDLGGDDDLGVESYDL